jgi:CRP-like cAMP-binding protein
VRDDRRDGDLRLRGEQHVPASPRRKAWPEHSLFGLLDSDTLAALRGLGRPREYAAGDVIVSRGDRTSFVCILINGIAKVTATSADGTDSLLAIRVAGEALTEFAVLDGKPRSATVTAATASTVQTVSAADFNAFLDAHVDAHRALHRSLTAKLRATVDSRIVVSGPVKVRLARLLLNLADSHGRSVSDGTAIDVPLSQPEMGNLIGASEVSVNKNLAEMKRRGFIAIPGYRRYVVRDPAGLLMIVAGDGPIRQEGGTSGRGR